MSNQLPSDESKPAAGDARLPYTAPTLANYGSLFVTSHVSACATNEASKDPEGDPCDPPDGGTLDGPK